MLKFENTANIGDRIRAYDFKPMRGRDDRFVEGVVVDKGYHNDGYKCYTIHCDNDSSAKDDYSRVDELVFVPMECSFMEYDARVTRIDI